MALPKSDLLTASWHLCTMSLCESCCLSKMFDFIVSAYVCSQGCTCPTVHLPSFGCTSIHLQKREHIRVNHECATAPWACPKNCAQPNLLENSPTFAKAGWLPDCLQLSAAKTLVRCPTVCSCQLEEVSITSKGHAEKTSQEVCRMVIIGFTSYQICHGNCSHPRTIADGIVCLALRRTSCTEPFNDSERSA